MKVVPEAGGEDQSRECLFVTLATDEIQIYKMIGREGWVMGTLVLNSHVLKSSSSSLLILPR